MRLYLWSSHKTSRNRCKPIKWCAFLFNVKFVYPARWRLFTTPDTPWSVVKLFSKGPGFFHKNSRSAWAWYDKKGRVYFLNFTRLLGLFWPSWWPLKKAMECPHLIKDGVNLDVITKVLSDFTSESIQCSSKIALY